MVPAPGKVWAPQTCVLVTPPGKLPSVESRGEELNGTVYAALGDARGSSNSGSGSSTGSSASGSGGNGSSGAGASAGRAAGDGGGGGGQSDNSSALSIPGSPLAAARGVMLRHDPNPDWLQYGGADFSAFNHVISLLLQCTGSRKSREARRLG